MNFENHVCHACGVPFKENDEIVVCPECGTPHHKACYFEKNECVHKKLHKDGYNYVPNIFEEKKLDVIIEEDVKKTEEVKGVFNVEYNSAEAENNKDIRNTIEELFKNINGKTTDQVLINNIPSSYFEHAVGKNQQYYMPRFFILERTGKKGLFNAVSFIFPFAWAIYRKMYKLAVLVFCIYTALFGVLLAPFFTNEEFLDSVYECALEDPDAYQNIMMYNQGQNVKLTKAQANFVNIVESIKISDAIIYGTFAVSILMKIFVGLNSTKLYKQKLEKNIKKAMKLNLDNLRLKNYLSTKYGVTPMIVAVFAAFIEYLFFGRF